MAFLITVVIPLYFFNLCAASLNDYTYFATENFCFDPTNEFMCRNKDCIPFTQRCDGEAQCSDASDELDCDIYLCEGPMWFKCKHSDMCISAKFECDGELDCADMSDELNCENSTAFVVVHNCTSNQWQCNDRTCIPLYQVCDENFDCPDHSDEVDGCTISHPCDGFRCQNNRCIPMEWRCNEIDDCTDNSDEKDCEKFVPPDECTMERNYFLCKNGKDCIRLDEVCDGTPQCPDQSDESSNCTNHCARANCSHECLQTPEGPVCRCPHGYKQISDKHCEDINECEIFGVCDQKCRNLDGSYECSCDEKYILQEDKKSCVARGGEALLIFSTKHKIRGLFLKSKTYFLIASKLKYVVGVAYTGEHIYWTNLHHDNEAIVKALPDGTNRELIVTAGISSPEDLAVDWVTGNIYFTDADLKHIGVCTNDGLHCTVVMSRYITKPRGIALNPADREMYWTDWGGKPEIARASMDGQKDVSFIVADIKWPNSITIDYPNRRLYWIDAKLNRIESIKLDGSDRRVILKGIVRHPYSIAVFENRLYWSDWMDHALFSCDKFTGKNRTTLLVENEHDIYGIHIYHSVLQPRLENPCENAHCSHICLLSSVSKYKCACPQEYVLNLDKHTCRPKSKKLLLAVGSGNKLFTIHHQTLGKHNIELLSTRFTSINALAYDSLAGFIIVSDKDTKNIYAVTEDGKKTVLLVDDEIENVEGMDFDYLSNNLYWCDSGRGVLEVFSIKTNTRKSLLTDLNGHVPLDVALIPQEGVMFVAVRTPELSIYIDKMNMDGTGHRIHVISEGLLGSRIQLAYDEESQRIFWACADTGNIESTSIEGTDRHGFRGLLPSPNSLTILGSDIFWSNVNSSKIYWADLFSNKHKNKRITIDLPKDGMYLLAVTGKKAGLTHPCKENNGNCSDICLVSRDYHYMCACPTNKILLQDNHTCVERKTCKSGEFQCPTTLVCIPADALCNGKRDCLYGEDETNCKTDRECLWGQKQCKNGQCIEENLWCNSHYDCKDKSDEVECDPSAKPSCTPHQFQCENTECIQAYLHCDGVPDCLDSSDEKFCNLRTCDIREFRCSSGKCIPETWHCDGSIDCPDSSDEDNCPQPTCDESLFTCENRRCIDVTLVCNGEDDCMDNSDELNCTTLELQIDENLSLLKCNEDEFLCPVNDIVQCLPEKLRCDGKADCPNGEDEMGCPGCSDDEFQCNNTKCIHESWVCDKVDDCGDTSDEEHNLCLSIPSKITQNNVTLYKPIPCPHGFKCKSGYCLDWKFVCNDEKDCEGGDDEGGNCAHACDTNPCQQLCLNTPSGAKCDCYPGFELQGDAKTCVDIKECTKFPPVCAEICIETNSSYRCSCFPHSQLRLDRTGCRALGPPMYIVFTSGPEIRKLVPYKNELYEIENLLETPPVTGLELSVAEDAVFYSIDRLGAVIKRYLKNDTFKIVRNLRKPTKLAFDWVTNNIYFVDEYSSVVTAIKVCHLEESKCAKILQVSDTISAITIDAVHKYLFYSTTRWWIYSNPVSTLYKVNLDGTHNVELIKENVEYITGISFDIEQKIVYFTDQSRGMVERIRYDGTHRELMMFSNTGSQIFHPYGLNFFEDHLYFLLANGIMKKCKLYGNLKCVDIRLHRKTVNYFAIGQQVRQIDFPNVCDGHSCSHLCIQSEVGIKCVCPNGQGVSEDVQCPPSTMMDEWEIVHFNDTNEILSAKHDVTDSTEGSHSHLTGIILTLLIILIVLCGLYYFYKQKYSGTFSPGSLINFQYTNPIYNLQTVAKEKNYKDLPKSNSTSSTVPLQADSTENHEFYNPLDSQSEVTFTAKTEECSIRK